MHTIQIPSTSSPVFDTVLALLRSAIWGESRFPFQAPADTDWDAVYKELKLQTVHNLPVDILCRENPTQTALYTKNAVQNMRHWLKIMQLQQTLCQQLQTADIPCVVLKGAAAACYYPEPTNRIMGDIDLLVKPKDFDRACQIISADAEYLGENSRHKEYKRNGITVELHRSFSNMRNPEKNHVLDTHLFTAIDSAESISTNGYSFSKLPTAENGLVLLFHIDSHLEHGLGLRQILDWMYFVDQKLTDELWQTKFEPVLNLLERKNLAVVVTRMCQMYLGLRSDILWCSDADEQLCQKLMEYIFLQGNFGKKNIYLLACAVAVTHTSIHKQSFFKILQQRGCRNWKALNHYPYLKPFAWLYQLIRYFNHGCRLLFRLRSKQPLKLFLKYLKNHDDKTTLMEEIGVSQTPTDG